MITSEHGGHAGEQRLGGADVARGFLTADVLFPGLEREAQGRAAAGVLGHAHDAALPAASAVSAVMALPAMALAASGESQGLGATYPMTILADATRLPRMCSTTLAVARGQSSASFR